MTIANLGRQHQRSLNSCFKSSWEYLYMFGAIISYYFIPSILLKLVKLTKLILLKFCNASIVWQFYVISQINGEVDLGMGDACPEYSNFSGPDRKLVHACPPEKNHCPCIFEGHLSTNPILSAMHLQGPKSNLYLHFHWVNKQLTRTSFSKWNHQ